jgi:apolipoprotein N-acyltransferase
MAAERVTAPHAGAGALRHGLALAALAAGTTVLAFPPFGIWPLALVMLAPLSFALARARPRAAFGLGYAYTLAMALAIVRWLVYALAGEYGVALAKAWAFTAALVAAYALVPAAALALFAALRPRMHDALAPLALAALYALSEWLRAAPLGLPWLLAAHALAPAPALLQSADVFGAGGASFLAVASSAGVGFAIAQRTWRPLALPSLLWLAVLGYAAVDGGNVAGRASLRVGVVQPAIPQHERWRDGGALAHVEQQLALTRTLLADARALDLVVWPETAIDAVLESDPRLLTAVRRHVEASQVPLVAGGQRMLAGVSNSAFLVAPRRGLVESYEKQRLVPFAESRPAWGAVLRPLLSRVERGLPYRAGDAARVFTHFPVPLGAPICFEITYAPLVREFAKRGARVLLNLSNDAWFGRSGYAELHLAHAVLRAIELRTPIVRASASGISALIDARGRIAQRLPLGARGTLFGEVRANAAPTLYARYGDAPFFALVALAVVASFTPLRRS